MVSSCTFCAMREIEPLAEIGNARLRVLVLLLGDIERLLDGGELAAQRRDLLVEHLDLGERVGGNLLLPLDLAGEFRYLPLRLAGGG